MVFCSGKVYFDLLKARRKEGLRDVALLRIEQLYPFPNEEYQALLNRYPNAREVVWCQEEPQNQGAWYQIRHRLQELVLGRRPVLYAGRAPAAAPATGITKIHEIEQQALVAAALHSNTTEESGRDTTRLTALPATAANPAPAALPAAATIAGADEKALMSTEIRVPQLPESVADATLVDLAQAARRCHPPRRESGRSRDRQGGAGGAGAGQRRGARAAREERHGGEKRPGARRHRGRCGRRQASLRRRHRRRQPRRRAGHRGERCGGGRGQAPKSAPGAAPAAATDAGRLSPSVRRLVEENQLDPARIPASGRDGRLTKSDVVDYLGRQPAEARAPRPRLPSATPPPGAAPAAALARAPESRPPAVGRARRAARADDAAAGAHRAAADRGAVDPGAAHDVQRGRPHRHAGAARALPRALREGARRQARLHVVFRQGRDRCAEEVPGGECLRRRQRHPLPRVLRHRRGGLDRARADRARSCAMRTARALRCSRRRLPTTPAGRARARSPSRT